jgi:hypothetical protein
VALKQVLLYRLISSLEGKLGTVGDTVLEFLFMKLPNSISALLSTIFHMLEAGEALGGGHQPLWQAAALLLSQEQLINANLLGIL